MKIEDRILELCSEDDYGVWELWWAIEAESDQSSRTAELKSRFVKSISNLVAQGKLVAKRRDSHSAITGQAKPVEFAAHIVSAEMNEIDNPRPEEMYWFGTS